MTRQLVVPSIIAQLFLLFAQRNIDRHAHPFDITDPKDNDSGLTRRLRCANANRRRDEIILLSVPETNKATPSATLAHSISGTEPALDRSFYRRANLAFC